MLYIIIAFLVLVVIGILIILSFYMGREAERDYLRRMLESGDPERIANKNRKIEVKNHDKV